MSATVEPGFHRATATMCREQSPQWLFAAHMLPKATRADVLTLRAVLHQLHAIMFADEDAGGCCQSQPAGPHQICHAVLDHLWAGEPTGKDELDGFAEMQRRLDLPRERFNRIINGWAAMNKTPRIATWPRFRDLHERVGAAMVDLLLRVINAPLEDTARHQADSIALAMSITHTLAGLSTHLKRGIVPLPLDDLVRFGIADREVLRWSVKDQTDDKRWLALVDYQVQRALTLLHGGAKSATVIESSATRRALAVLVRTYELWLVVLSQRANHLPAEPVTLSHWQRIRALAGVYATRPVRDNRRLDSERSTDDAQQPVAQSLEDST